MISSNSHKYCNALVYCFRIRPSHNQNMNKIYLGLLCGLVFGLLDIIVMLPMKYPDARRKAEAISSAFIDRFAIGFIIPNLELGINPILTGFLVGLVLSLPSAIITRVYAPIIGTGAVGGAVIGFVVTLI